MPISKYNLASYTHALKGEDGKVKDTGAWWTKFCLHGRSMRHRMEIIAASNDRSRSLFHELLPRPLHCSLPIQNVVSTEFWSFWTDGELSSAAVTIIPSLETGSITSAAASRHGSEGTLTRRTSSSA